MDVFTLMTSRVKENASFAHLKQQGAILKALLEAVVSESQDLEDVSPLMETGDVKQFSDTRILNQVLDVHNENTVGSRVITVLKVTDIIPHFLLMFYETAAQNDVELRHEWLVELFTKCKRKCQAPAVKIFLEKYQKTSQILKGILCQAFSSCLHFHENLMKSMCSMSDLPWDIRWLPDIAAFCDPKCSACTAVNKLFLLLYFGFKKIQAERVTKGVHSGKRSSLTVMEYSMALMHGM
jgi:hypothetical protein